MRVASRKLTKKERQKLVVLLHRGTTGDWNWDILANEFELDDLKARGFAERGTRQGTDWRGLTVDDP